PRRRRVGGLPPQLRPGGPDRGQRLESHRGGDGGGGRRLLQPLRGAAKAAAGKASRPPAPPGVESSPVGRWRLVDRMLSAVLALGITQITAWGTSYYCLGVLAAPIARDTGWSRGFVFLGFTVALLAMGLVSGAAGRAIDRYGARAVMTLGTLLVSA